MVVIAREGEKARAGSHSRTSRSGGMRRVRSRAPGCCCRWWKLTITLAVAVAVAYKRLKKERYVR
jgi:hypothetical protein